MPDRELAEKAVDIERQGRHARGDLALPDLARAVPVDLDPVPIGVAQVDRLAHEVIGEPDQRHAVASARAPASGRARRARAPAGRSGRGRCGRRAGRAPRFLDQHEQLTTARAERRAAGVPLEHVEPDRACGSSRASARDPRPSGARRRRWSRAEARRATAPPPPRAPQDRAAFPRRRSSQKPGRRFGGPVPAWINTAWSSSAAWSSCRRASTWWSSSRAESQPFSRARR